ncbi:PDR/VanB family oxidoreductase [Micromonospora endophytica]|uniref:Oxidoreductase n=1 Tax=Micromonospora endophytica TaxID=515350 RepID=A0A2W2DC23_9ACTN|nr:PDR/VanB family oxidoreductase [Micromonospora endophytica]PZF94616.1 oxidoreductase [Micromonospora endophytica]RIW44818.1 oxidoreductase [Micromonospora endophytica]BCJ57544.1 ferredoxin [Micromonospora endophytica]
MTGDNPIDKDLLVAGREEVAVGVAVLTLCRPDGNDLPAWSPGAHVDLALGPDLVRSYSLCGDPADRGAWQVAIQREPDGRGGSRLAHERLTPGTTVRVRGPRNNFALRPARRYLFVAGGIGITPIRPMVAAADAAGADWRLVYGGRSRTSMAFAATLREKYGDRVSLHPQDETGLLDLDGLLHRPTGELVYCCGPASLIDAVLQRCQAWPSGTLHIERFTAVATEAGVETAVEVELALSGRTVTVPPGTSILAAVEQAGVQVLSSCREGTCGTCETTVLAGEPEHRDSLLTEEERAAGDTMMICVSRARSPRLTLEL